MEISKQKRLLLKSILPMGAMASLGSVGLLSACGGGSGKGNEKTQWINGVRLPNNVFEASDVNRVAAFSNLNRMEPTVPVKAGGTVRALSEMTPTRLTVQIEAAVTAYLNASRTAGILILKNGEIVSERYREITKDTKWTSFSVVKSVTGTLVGAAVKERKLALNDQITTFLPRLNGSAYAGVTVNDLLHMRSGVHWNDIAGEGGNLIPLLAAARKKQKGAVLDYLASLPKSLYRETEERYPYNYNSGDSHVLGAVLEAATSTPLHQYLSDKIWKPAGMEADGYWWSETESQGTAFGGGGLSATLRDYGRFGQFILEGAKGNLGESILPGDWAASAYSDSSGVIRQGTGYGYHWHTLSPRTTGNPESAPVFFANGIYGQQIVIDRQRQSVIVLLSHWSAPESLAEGSKQDVLVDYILANL